MNIKLKEIMVKRVVTVEMDDSLRVVNEIFETMKFHHLLVVDHKKLTGVISDRDLFKALSPNLGTMSATVKDEQTLEKKVHQIMTRNPICGTSDETVGDAIKRMILNDISCLPIIVGNNQIEGIVSWKDFLRKASEFVEENEEIKE
ncbi:MAG: CBS domain-containing protein [Candidatus Lindowbacteria bacterium]|nr:CBS domain-containing protein [Candidatus Lindowbacteria bacterium]